MNYPNVNLPDYPEVKITYTDGGPLVGAEGSVEDLLQSAIDEQASIHAPDSNWAPPSDPVDQIIAQTTRVASGTDANWDFNDKIGQGPVSRLANFLEEPSRSELQDLKSLKDSFETLEANLKTALTRLIKKSRTALDFNDFATTERDDLFETLDLAWSNLFKKGLWVRLNGDYWQVESYAYDTFGTPIVNLKNLTHPDEKIVSRVGEVLRANGFELQ